VLDRRQLDDSDATLQRYVLLLKRVEDYLCKSSSSRR
jgi:hypothetical protein